MRTSTLQRMENIRRLVAAFADGGMRPTDVARLLRVSDRTARNYLDELEFSGVLRYESERRSHMKLNPDATVVQGYLASLTEGMARLRVSLRRSDSPHGAAPGERYLHVLADDTKFPLALHQEPAGRDPLVAALFGGTPA